MTLFTSAPPTCVTSVKVMKFRWRCPTACLASTICRASPPSSSDTYEALYGRKGPDVPLEVINWRVVASGPRPDMNLKLPRDSTHGERRAQRFASGVTFPKRNGYVETAIYDRYTLEPGMQFAGPAIVEERESTLIVGVGGRARVDERLERSRGVRRWEIKSSIRLPWK